MVDFKKKLKKGEIDKKINPLEIYDSLDRKTVTGPLRPAQQSILNDWYINNQEEKDLIIKLHTGEGKTLIGLLILQSKLNQDLGPCLFVCPNIYLVQQVSQEAKKFGIAYCLIGPDNVLPNDFLEGKSILITHVQKVFNGKSKFGIDNSFCKIGVILLDDSHTCIDYIKDAFTVRIDKDHVLYDSILTMFESDLKEQGEGSYLDIKTGASDTLMLIPYWAWIDKKSEVLSLLSNYKDDNILFAWSVIKNCIENCQAFITSNGIEIIPHHIPVRIFGSFSMAKQRILMSATTQDDSFFIKGLGFSIDAVKKPLTHSIQKWSGEKMLLIPSLIDENLDRDLVVTHYAKPAKLNYGRVSIVSSFKKTDQYLHLGSSIANAKDIFAQISNLKQGNFENTLVIVNRYDGIDLPDEACRLLILDSMPFFNSLIDRYEEQCRLDSEIINIKLAQRIEQGFGRSVRGEKDYSVILIIGPDLVKFIRSVKTNKYFSAQTKKQIEIGFQIAELAKEDLKVGESTLKVLNSLIDQSIERDEGWKEFYKEEMDSIGNYEVISNNHEILKLEKDAEESNSRGDNENACFKIQKIIDDFKLEDSERGWYLQILARYKYFLAKSESNTLQKSAFVLNLQLLKPRDGISYKKLEYINENRIRRIKDWISKFNAYEEVMLSVESTLNDFTFGTEAEKFELAVKEIGNILGFISQRPDKEFKKGPDNLWGVDNKFFLIECKSEVYEKREDINKHESGQMNSHSAWFESEYGDLKVKRILIIPTKNLSYSGDFSHKVEIMRKGKLDLLKKNLKSFIKEFKSYKINELTDEKIQSFINHNKLDIADLENEYTEEYYHKKQIERS